MGYVRAVERRAVARVPDEMFDPFRAVRLDPIPLNTFVVLVNATVLVCDPVILPLGIDPKVM